MSVAVERPVRVLVVEDSPTAREYLIALLEEDPALRVVGDAPDGERAVIAAARVRPDVVLMDVHMPGIDGYEATTRIMETIPTPVIIVSAMLGVDHAAAAVKAMKAGALSVVVKPPAPGQPGHAEAAHTLVEQAKLMAEVKVVRRRPARGRPQPVLATPRLARRIAVIAIGASTGGPQALAQILPGLPADLPCPVLVVQHIAPGFVLGLARVLGEDTRLRVKPAAAGELARPGSVYLAPDGYQMGLSRAGRIRLTDEAAHDGFRPSVSYLFESVAQTFGRDAIGIVLTGMSGDGANGLKTLRDEGGVTIAQDEESSVVFGMPMEAIRLGAAEHVLPLSQIAATVHSLMRSGGEDG